MQDQDYEKKVPHVNGPCLFSVAITEYFRSYRKKLVLAHCSEGRDVQDQAATSGEGLTMCHNMVDGITRPELVQKRESMRGNLVINSPFSR